MSRKKPGPVRRLIGTLFRLLLMLLLLALTACAAVGAYIMATAPEISIADDPRRATVQPCWTAPAKKF